MTCSQLLQQREQDLQATHWKGTFIVKYELERDFHCDVSAGEGLVLLSMSP